ncbi:hypothetical protein ACFV0Z_27400 [Streptomyces xiamenensis]|uniref:hypothetical protein n=1 Tax=Streptomyces xiamenensis TaxID=408015 RepID=UPI0036B487B3
MLSHAQPLAQPAHAWEGDIPPPEAPTTGCTGTTNIVVHAVFPPGDASPVSPVVPSLTLTVAVTLAVSIRIVLKRK